MTPSLTRLVLLGTALTLLAGCGLRGGLERPDPIWDAPNAEDLEPATELPDTAESDSLLDEQIEEEEELLGGPPAE